jgi:predicted amidohydrolase
LVRVAAAQCEVGSDVEANVATLVRRIGEAAADGAQLVVLPEFANHHSVYDSPEHGWNVAIDVTDTRDAFVCAVAAAAQHNGIWVVAGATVRRRPATHDERARITVTQMLFSPADGLVAESDKQVLMGDERTYLSEGGSPGKVVDTPLGRIGLYCSTDGLIAEPARSLVVSGAEILCVGLDSCASDHASLHVPSRAAENGVWVVACCKVGPLLAEGNLTGAGRSQVVAPDGTVVGIAPATGEALVTAEVDLDAVREHRRADGTSALGLRRPEVYFPIAAEVPSLPSTAADTLSTAALQLGTAALQLDTAALQLDRIVSQVRDLAAEGVALIVLPELAAHPGGLVADPAHGAARDADMLDALAEALVGTSCLVVASVVSDMDGHAETGFAHLGVVVSSAGVLMGQPALHSPERHRSWQVDLGDRVKVLATAFGRLSVLPGDDAIVPESARLAVLGGAEIVAMPFTVTEAADLSLVVPQRCAENRVCVVLASRSGPAGGAAGFDPPEVPMWSDPARPVPFAGTINAPDRYIARVNEDCLQVTVHPGRTAQKLVDRDTDLVAGRRPELRTDLVTSLP